MKKCSATVIGWRITDCPRVLSDQPQPGSNLQALCRRSLDCPRMRPSFRVFGPMPTTGERFERAVAIMARLRAPGGCPWDREQTFDTIKPYTLEETYEVLEAIDNRDWEAIKAQEKAEARGDAETSGEQKSESSKPESALAGVSSGLPALLEAGKLSSRAANVGFDWPNIDGLFDKLREETEELRAELREYPAPGPQPRGKGIAGSGRAAIPEELRLRLEEEVGDLFFVLVNISRFLALDSELALKKTNRKFRRRFQQVEHKLRESGHSAQQTSL